MDELLTNVGYMHTMEDFDRLLRSLKHLASEIKWNRQGRIVLSKFMEKNGFEFKDSVFFGLKHTFDA